MSQGKGKRNRSYHNKSRVNIGDKGREILENIDENSLVIQQFRGYAAELDEKHDRYERIVKIGRDITIESKRIIFLLHTLDKECKRVSVLNDAKHRLENIRKFLFKNIAYELEGQDPYQYFRAYRGGLEEYVEAVTFYQYLQNASLKDWTELQKSLTYTVPIKSKSAEDEAGQTKTLRALVTPHEYILGIADLTGELMRKCINNLATGDIVSCFQICNLLRIMYKGFLGFTSISSKEMNKKLYTLKQSLTKLENVWYTIKVRGSEIPEHMLVDVAIGATEDYTTEEDEGYKGL